MILRNSGGEYQVCDTGKARPDGRALPLKRQCVRWRRNDSKRVVENSLSSCVELRKQVKFQNVACKHHAAIFRRGEKDQCIVERFASIIFAVSLEPDQKPSEYAGFAPYIPIRSEYSVGRS